MKFHKLSKPGDSLGRYFGRADLGYTMGNALGEAIVVLHHDVDVLPGNVSIDADGSFLFGELGSVLGCERQSAIANCAVQDAGLSRGIDDSPEKFVAGNFEREKRLERAAVLLQYRLPVSAYIAVSSWFGRPWGRSGCLLG